MSTLSQSTLRHAGSRRTGSDTRTLVLDPASRLTAERLERFVRAADERCELSGAARRAMERSCAALAGARARGEQIYGLTTGFGPHVKYAACASTERQGAGLIAHLGAGFGRAADDDVALATMVLRARTLARGMSGISVDVAETLVALINARVTPLIPEIGSVGASGDLTPLSFLARLMMGEGPARRAGETMPAMRALELSGCAPLTLGGRDALALVNGTSFMSAYAALALVRAKRLIERCELVTGWIYRVLGCRAEALDPRLHRARGHAGQARSADVIRSEAGSNGPWEDVTRPLQEVYSLRCAPQVLGACRDQIEYAGTLIEREINGVNDNPVVWCGETETDEAVLHGGNFQGQQLAFAADALNAALVQAAVLAERQLDVLVNPELNGGAPLLLAWEPGATSGLAGAQLTATALVAEMRHHGGPVATSSIPTNGRNQDVVSMGTLAARAALAQTDRLAGVLAATCIGADQLTFLRSRGRAPGRVAPRPSWAPAFEAFEADRPLHDDLMRIAGALVAPDDQVTGAW
ncbi:MAG: aromatic amino acid ammonia-lyase [Planctomycetota bacterium]|nr:aromatic amino acid ammonia-lyase [Planctomycetota bacterium]